MNLALLIGFDLDAAILGTELLTKVVLAFFFTISLLC